MTYSHLFPSLFPSDRGWYIAPALKRSQGGSIDTALRGTPTEDMLWDKLPLMKLRSQTFYKSIYWFVCENGQGTMDFHKWM